MCDFKSCGHTAVAMALRIILRVATIPTVATTLPEIVSPVDRTKVYD